jgi:tyrosyl-tRNA synthetase
MVNDVQVTDENQKHGKGDIADGVIKLSSGKKKHVLLEV